MNNELPGGWAECLMGDIAEVAGGGTPDTKDDNNFSTSEGIPWLTPADLSGYEKIYISRGKRFLTTKGYKSSSARLMPKGTVLFSSRAPIGYVAVAANEIATNQGFKSFICRDEIYPEYIYYYLKHAKPLAEHLASGTTFAEISGKNAAKIPLLLAPIPEQRRIAAKLEELSSQVDACQKRLAKIPALLKRFRQSVLAAACSGQLTKDWHSHEEPWRQTYLGDILVSATNGVSKRKGDVGEEVTVLRLADYTGNSRLHGKERKIRLTDEEKKKYELSFEDILVIRVNGSRHIAGRFIVYESKDEAFCDHFVRLRCDRKRANPKFIAHTMNSGAARQSIEAALVTSAGQNTISQKSLRAIEFELPSLAEQNEIVRQVYTLLQQADEIETRYAKSQAHVDKLAPSLLAKAFRGDLVRTEAEIAETEDREYEPATVLIERIRSEHDSLKTESKTKRSRERRRPRKNKSIDPGKRQSERSGK